MSMAAASVPSLPPELERAIFQQAAYDSPRSIPTMMLVAWRFKVWLEPLLYRIVTILGRTSQSPLKDYPTHPLLHDEVSSSRTTLIQSSVRHLCVNAVSLDDVQHVLPASRGVQNLWISTAGWNYPMVPLIGALRPRRLYCYLETLLFDPRSPMDCTHDLFSHLTHLEILRIFRAHAVDAICEGLALIPHLTHLAFNDVVMLPHSLRFLRTCGSMRVLVFLGRQNWDYYPRELTKKLENEPRFVHVRCDERIKDWHMGALRGRDYWSRAEDFTTKRRTGEIDPYRFQILDDESQYLR